MKLRYRIALPLSHHRHLHPKLLNCHSTPSTSTASNRSMASDPVIFPEPPTGYQAHQESTTQILIRSGCSKTHQPSEAFINPVQEYNRDLSISCIRTWSSVRNQELQDKSEKTHQKKSLTAQNKTRNKKRNATEAPSFTNNHEPNKRNKTENPTDLDPAVDSLRASDSVLQERQLNPSIQSVPDPNTTQDLESSSITNIPPDDQSTDPSRPSNQFKFTPQKFSALEALSATGLRAIRYAKEIPSLKWVIANDLSPSAVNLIKLNITHNGLEQSLGPNQEGKVRVTQGDACDLMYAHRPTSKQFDVVDLDPYGSAAPFMDAAVQCVKDGGLLCVTCTDLAVLAGHAYPEKCFSNYGGSSMRAEYSHEYALRQVIHGLASSAARYGKSIKPMLSLSIDFYVRIFVRVFNSPAQVKKLITNTALVYVCSGCSVYHFQPLGRSAAKPTKSGTQSHESYHNSAGPPVSSGSQCEECGGKFHVAGPLWSGPLHDQEFCQKVLDDVEESGSSLKTSGRIKGMVRIAKMEIPDSPFYFTPTKLSGLFKCTSPSLTTVGSAILNAGYQISRSHCSPGSIKTNAPRRFLYDLMKKWIDSNRNPKQNNHTTEELDHHDETKLDEKNHPGEVNQKKDEEKLNLTNNQVLKQYNDEEKEINQVEEESDRDQKQIQIEKCKHEENNGNDQACAEIPLKRPHNNPSSLLLSKPPVFEVDLKYNKSVEKSLMSNLKIVRYQSNPLPNWGPKAKALKK